MDLVLSSLENTTTIGFVSFIILCLFIFRFSKVSQAREAPTISGAWPILGHLPLLSGTQTPHKTLGELADKYGPLFTIKIGSKRALVLNNWELAKECFTTIDKIVSSRPKLIAFEIMAYNGAMFGFAPYGPYWRQMRKIVTLEVLTNRRVEQLQHVRVLEVQTSIKELFDVWRNKKNKELNNYVLVDLKEWFTHLAFNMVLQMAVGKRYFGQTTLVAEEEVQRCLKALREFMRLLGVFIVGDAIPCLKWFDIGGHMKGMKKTAKELDKIIGEWLEEHRQNRVLGEKLDSHPNFMDVMISLLDEKIIEEIDADNAIKSTILPLLAAGTDTSSVTLTWAICLLLRNPLVLKKAKEELDKHVGKERCIRESDIENLVYLQAIVKETLRLYPAGPLSLPREFTQNCNLGGYDVKKGTRLIVNLWKIHTDPNIWTNPLEFIPERFLTTHKDIDVRGHHFELLPFGGGRRICPEISFGLKMVHFTLASFLHSLEVINPSTEPIDMTEILGITNTKATPLNVLIKPRLSPNCYDIM